MRKYYLLFAIFFLVFGFYAYAYYYNSNIQWSNSVEDAEARKDNRKLSPDVNLSYNPEDVIDVNGHGGDEEYFIKISDNITVYNQQMIINKISNNALNLLYDLLKEGNYGIDIEILENSQQSNTSSYQFLFSSESILYKVIVTRSANEEVIITKL